MPVGLEDVSKYPALTAEPGHREYADQEILKILGGNVLRVMGDVEGRAEGIQAERGPSEALIDESDA